MLILKHHAPDQPTDQRKKKKKKIRKCLEKFGNESTTYRNLWDTSETLIKGKIIFAICKNCRKIINKQPDFLSH